VETAGIEPAQVPSEVNNRRLGFQPRRLAHSGAVKEAGRSLNINSLTRNEPADLN